MLVRHVRDAAAAHVIRTGRMHEFRRNYRDGIDVLLVNDDAVVQPHASAAVSARWQHSGAPGALHVIIPDVVDETILSPAGDRPGFAANEVCHHERLAGRPSGRAP